VVAFEPGQVCELTIIDPPFPDDLGQRGAIDRLLPFSIMFRRSLSQCLAKQWIYAQRAKERCDDFDHQWCFLAIIQSRDDYIWGVIYIWWRFNGLMDIAPVCASRIRVKIVADKSSYLDSLGGGDAE